MAFHCILNRKNKYIKKCIQLHFVITCCNTNAFNLLKNKKNKEIMHKQKHLIWTKILRFGLKYFFVNFQVHIYLFKKAL